MTMGKRQRELLRQRDPETVLRHRLKLARRDLANLLDSDWGASELNISAAEHEVARLQRKLAALKAPQAPTPAHPGDRR